MYNKRDRDMGCLGWFILGFLIFALFLLFLVLAFAPSGGDARPCESRANLTDRTGNTLRDVSNVSRTGVRDLRHLPGRVGGSSGGRGGGSFSRPSAPKPNFHKPTSPKLKSPKGGSGSHSGGVKLDIDTDDCD